VSQENLKLEKIGQKHTKVWHTEHQRRNWKHRYNLSPDDVLKMRLKQRDLCFICGKKNVPESAILQVDHCHNTGRVRKLLCSCCNRALGLSKESVWVLFKMIKYVLRHKFIRC